MRYLILFLSFFVLIACGGYSEFQNKATQNYSDEEMQKFAKYMIQGKSLYKAYCSNCHQEDGSGLGKVYPPIMGSDYLLQEDVDLACIIKNGLEGSITVKQVTYDQAMPANDELSDLEIAELCTYVMNSFGFEKGIYTIQNINTSLQECQ